MNTYPANISKHNSDHEKQIILLMIPNGEGWHCFAVKRMSVLLIGITSKYDCDLYSLNCLHLFITKNKLKLLKICGNNFFVVL